MSFTTDIPKFVRRKGNTSKNFKVEGESDSTFSFLYTLLHVLMEDKDTEICVINLYRQSLGNNHNHKQKMFSMFYSANGVRSIFFLFGFDKSFCNTRETEHKKAVHTLSPDISWDRSPTYRRDDETKNNKKKHAISGGTGLTGNVNNTRSDCIKMELNAYNRATLK